jgi:hypothetical protein
VFNESIAMMTTQAFLEENIKDWFIDSKAMKHMSNHYEWMTNFMLKKPRSWVVTNYTPNDLQIIPMECMHIRVEHFWCHCGSFCIMGVVAIGTCYCMCKWGFVFRL